MKTLTVMAVAAAFVGNARSRPGLSIDDEVDMTIGAVKIGASYKFGGSSHEPLK